MEQKLEPKKYVILIINNVKGNILRSKSNRFFNINRGSIHSINNKRRYFLYFI